MKNILTSGFAFVAAATLLTACATQQNQNSVSRLSDSQTAKVDKAFEMFVGEVPGASVMIAKGDELLFCKGYGVANFETGAVVTCDTNFRIASVSKQFTALAILQLIDRGQLTLETTLTDVFPDFPDYGKDVTIAHLLTHQAGLVDYSNLRRNDGARMRGEDVLNHLFSLDALDFPAGSKWSYSNTAYAILPEIISEITEQPFDEYMQENVFGPSGMTNTRYPFPLEAISNRAIGYTITGDEIEITDQTPLTSVMGDGSIYSSARDYFGWHKARVNSTLLSEKLNTATHTVQPGTNGIYGFGWFTPSDYDPDFTFVEHGGSSKGFIAFSAWIPDEDISVVIFANQNLTDENQFTVNLNQRARYLLHIATDGRFDAPEDFRE